MTEGNDSRVGMGAKKGGYRIPRFSELRYVIEFCEQTRNLEKVNQNDIFRALTKTRYKIDRERQAYSAIKRVGLPVLESKFRKGYLKEGVVVDFIKFGLNLGLLRQSETPREFILSTSLKKIGEASHLNNTAEAKIFILDRIICSGSYRLFDPTRFLMPIRNQVIESVIPFRVVKEQSNKKKKRIEPLEPIPIAEEEGTGYKNDHRLIYDVLQTNPIRLDVMLNWGSFFGLLNFFWPDFEKPKYEKRKNESLFIPNKGFYLSKIIVSCAELLKLNEILSQENVLERDEIGRRLGLTRYATTCVLYAGLRLDMVSRQKNDEISIEKRIDDLKSLVNEATRIGAIIVSDGEAYRGLVDSPDLPLETNHTVLLFEREWSLPKFFQALKDQYYSLVKGETVLYAPIFRLRGNVCKALRMHDETFDRYLRLCVKSKDFSSNISLGVLSPEMRQRLGARGLEKAFILSGTSYSQIKVR